MVAAIVRVEKTRRTVVAVFHSDGHREVGMIEANGFAELDELVLGQTGRHGSMTHAGSSGENATRLRVFEGPSHAAVLATSKLEFFGSFFIDMMKRSAVFVESAAEADQDFVVPGPDSVVSRPTRESAFFAIDNDVPRRFRQFLGDGKEGQNAEAELRHTAVSDRDRRGMTTSCRIEKVLAFVFWRRAIIAVWLLSTEATSPERKGGMLASALQRRSLHRGFLRRGGPGRVEDSHSIDLCRALWFGGSRGGP